MKQRKMNRVAQYIFPILGLGIGIFLLACGGGSNKKVYFGNLADGASVESPLKIEMKAENLIVEPSSMGVTEGHGHFHIIVDASIASPSEPMNKDAQHIHYGNGQSETTLDLPVGKHNLILQFAKGNHVPYDPPVYQEVNITVTKQNKVDTTAVSTVANSSHVDSTKSPNLKADSTKKDTTKHSAK